MIAFIGAGNMASSLIGGLVDDNYPAENIIVTDQSKEKSQALAGLYGIQVANDNISAVKKANIIVLCVKPQVMKSVVTEIANHINSEQCIISIAAGTKIDSISEWLGKKASIIRCMPNTPALIKCGATGMFANDLVTKEQKMEAESILRAVGVIVWLKQESQLDIVTAVSGSGPAYFFLLMEICEQVGLRLGLPADCVHLLVLQTALGAAKMALESDSSVATLRQQVTSPGGTTEAALRTLEEGNIRALVSDAIKHAKIRSEELSKI
ncbi:MAG: pyrroline-5-carboxylate reductase [Gammaproteobacteria bacterium]